MLTLLAADPAPFSVGVPAIVELPLGLIGFPHYTRFRLEAAQDGPFFWFTPSGEEEVDVCFLVLDAAGWVPGYELELFDEDADWLGIGEPSDVRIFNIVKLDPEAPGRAAVNLVGPVLIRRENAVGKQVILANHQRYSAEHLLGSVIAAH